MRHPFDPENDVRPGRFLIQEPDLRVRILPLFAFDQACPDERVVGQGTAFRLDPFARCATAFHVFEEVFYLGGANGREMRVKQDRILVALELEGIVLGTAPIRRDQWRSIKGAFANVAIDDPPLSAPVMRNLTELLSLLIPPSSQKPKGTEFLNVDLTTWKPSLGEPVLGIGYPNLDKDEGASDTRPISQYMYGAFGRITDIEPLDLSRRRPWPMIRVSADWPGGMSGGPVFNSTGDVVGVISAGIDASNSTAMVFGGWGAASQTFPTLDRARPGRFLCFGVLGTTENLIAVSPSRTEAGVIAAQNHGSIVSKISLDPHSGGFIRFEL
jgi:serine protease Do